MLLETIPPIFFEKYHDSIRQHLPESQTGHGTNSFNAGELVEFIKTSAKQAEKILMYREFLVNSDNYMKPCMNKDGIVPGHYEMDDKFVADAFDKGYLRVIRKELFESYQLTFGAARGVACNVDEISQYQRENLTGDNKESDCPNPWMKHRTKREPFVIRVQKCTDFKLFRELRHVGLWGEKFYEDTSKDPINHQETFEKYEKENESFLLFDVIIINDSII